MCNFGFDGPTIGTAMRTARGNSDLNCVGRNGLLPAGYGRRLYMRCSKVRWRAVTQYQ
jgi:hypothetical protein